MKFEEALCISDSLIVACKYTSSSALAMKPIIYESSELLCTISLNGTEKMHIVLAKVKNELCLMLVFPGCKSTVRKARVAQTFTQKMVDLDGIRGCKTFFLYAQCSSNLRLISRIYLCVIRRILLW